MNLVPPSDPRLRKKVPPTVWGSDPTGRVSDEQAAYDLTSCLTAQAEAMTLYLRQASTGLSLAANQVGLNPRMFVLSPAFAPSLGFTQDTPRVYINPSVTASGGYVSNLETCPNFPGLHVNVMRTRTVEIWALNPEGEPFNCVLVNEAAWAVARAIDLLNGITIMDHSCFGETGYVSQGTLLLTEEMNKRFPPLRLQPSSLFANPNLGKGPSKARMYGPSENFAEQSRAAHAGAQAVDWAVPGAEQQLAHDQAVRAVHIAAAKVRAMTHWPRNKWKRGFRHYG